MNRHEEGYIFAEFVISLFVFGILLSFIVPLFKELKIQQLDQMLELEASSFLQEQMELLSRQCSVVPIQGEECKGEEQKTSLMYDKQTYQVKWECQVIEYRIIQINAKIEWYNGKKKRRILKLTTHRYQKLEKTSKGLPMLKWLSL